MAAALFTAVIPVRAETYYWVNPIGGSWGDTNNWDPPRIPGPDDSAAFTNSAVVILDANRSVGYLELELPHVVLDLAGHVLEITVHSGGTWEGSLVVSNGTLAVSGDLHTLYLGGFQLVDATLRISSEGSLNIQHGGRFLLCRATIDNSGTITQSGSDLLAVFDGPDQTVAITNRPGAVYEALNYGDIISDSSGGTNGQFTFYNAGTFRSTQGLIPSSLPFRGAGWTNWSVVWPSYVNGVLFDCSPTLFTNADGTNWTLGYLVLDRRMFVYFPVTNALQMALPPANPLPLPIVHSLRGVTFENSGLIDIQDGALCFDHGFRNEGTIRFSPIVSSNLLGQVACSGVDWGALSNTPLSSLFIGSLQLAGRAVSFEPTTQITGAGRIIVSADQLSLKSSVPDLVVSNSVVTGQAMVTRRLEICDTRFTNGSLSLAEGVVFSTTGTNRFEGVTLDSSGEMRLEQGVLSTDTNLVVRGLLDIGTNGTLELDNTAVATFASGSVILRPEGQITGAGRIEVPGAVLSIAGSHALGQLGLSSTGMVAFVGTNLWVGEMSLADDARSYFGGGGALTVSNTLVLRGRSRLETGSSWNGLGRTINASNVLVEADARIEANGMGYGGGVANTNYADGWGPGQGFGSAIGGGSGAGHGGRGGSSTNAPGGAINDSASRPGEWGSGGGASSDGLAQGGTGGGTVRMNVTDSFTLDGLITAHGADGTGTSAGGGAGGAIWISANKLAGNGAFLANGGAGYGLGGGGGGGCVAIYYEQDLGFTGGTNSLAHGGASAWEAGDTGTVGFFDTSVSNLHLHVFHLFVTDTNTVLGEVTVHPGGKLLLASNSRILGRVTLDGGEIDLLDGATNVSFGTLTATTNGIAIAQVKPGELQFDGIWVPANARLEIGGGTHVRVLGDLTVDGTLVAGALPNGSQTTNNWPGPGVFVSASNILVAAGGTITGDGQGYQQPYGLRGQGPGAHDPIGGGAHGGQGSDGGQTYGLPTQPITVGSSGGGEYVDGWRAGGGGAGGGAIRLEVSDTFTLNGVVSADGLTGTFGESEKDGGGAGGSLWVEANKLVGSGTFSAVGGLGSINCGGGGRVAVYYRDGSAFTGCTNATVASGVNGATRGQNGTLAFFDVSGGTNHYKLFVPRDRFTYDINPLVDTAPIFTNIALGAITVGTPGSTDCLLELNQVSRLTVDGSIVMSLGLFQTRPDAAISVGSSLTLSNGAFFQLGGGSTLAVADTISVLDSTTTLLVQAKNITGQVDGAWRATGGNLRAARVVVGPGAQISADAQGYVGAYGQYGLGPGASGPVGAGGYGGAGSSRGGGGPAYGSALHPLDVGSSGGGVYMDGWRTGTGGTGGGAIHLVVTNRLILDGTITANAGPGASEKFGGGAGGSVWVETGFLEGSGFFTATGSDGDSYGGGGGGGRIAVYARDSTGFMGYTSSTVAPGANPESGQVGTMGFFDTSGGVNQYRLFVPRDRFTCLPGIDLNLASITVGTPGSTSALLELGKGSELRLQDLTVTAGRVQFGQDSLNRLSGSLALSGGATVALGGGAELEVAGTLSLVDSNSTLLAQSKNVSGQVSGQWQAAGATIRASNIIVNSGTHISADGQGYLGAYNAYGLGPGAAGPVGAGSHGGTGASGGPVYDSSLAPSQPGSSGGGAYVGGWSSGTGGTGGGVVHLVVTNQLTLEGQISADAGPGGGPESFGGGAGGAIWVEAGILTGGGWFSAQGSLGTANGGGGGRIAVYYTNATAFTGFTNTTVMAGSGSQPGQDGTLVFGDTSLGPDRVQLLVPGYRFVFPSSTPGSGSLTLGLAGGSPVVCDLPADTFLRLSDNLTIREGAVMNVGGGSSIEVGGAVSLVGSNSALVAQGKSIYSPVDGQWAGAGLTIIASNLTVETGAKLTADGQGYYGGWWNPGYGPGNGGWMAGGSYGGHGGGGGPTYGSGEAPVDLGSAGGGMYDSGGSWPTAGGSGGGAIHLIVRGTTAVEGAVGANGADGYDFRGWYGGGGSGGSIWIETDTLTGNGFITASGGIGGAAGGGGRIAVYRRQLAGFDVSQIQAQPGNSGWGGEPGTIFISGLVPLQIMSCSPTGVAMHAVDHLDVTFSSAVNQSTLGTDDLIFTTPSGAVSSDQLALARIGGTSYRIFCPLQWTMGAYTLRVGPDVSSTLGQPMTGADTNTFTIDWPSVAGTVHTPQGWGVGGVTILTNGVAASTSGTNGVYALVLPPDWTGDVSAQLLGTTITPASRSYTDLTAQLTGKDYTMTTGFIPTVTSQHIGSALRVAWPSLLGLRYQVKSSDDLVTWNDCGPLQAGTGGPFVLDFTTTNAPRQFFRLLLNP